MKFIIGIFLLSFSVACQKHAQPEISFREYSVEDIPKDVKIPSKLWDQIEGKDLPFDPKAPVKSDEAGGFSVIYSPVEVSFVEKNDQVLAEENVKIHLPRGGGEIDLASHIGKSPGSFFVRFQFPEFSEEDAKAQDLRAWFVSRAKKRKMGTEVVGAGCSAWFEISKKFKSLNNQQGIKVNTTRNRHTSILGGSFIFSWKKNGQTYLSHVNFTDTENMNLFCEEKTAAE